jgi:hypothetical protein
MKHSNITIVNIDGRPGDLISTQMALIHSQAQLPGSKALLLAPQKPQVLIGETFEEESDDTGDC